MSVHVSSVSSLDFPSDKVIIADINFFVKFRYCQELNPKKLLNMEGEASVQEVGRNIFTIFEKGVTSDQPGITISKTVWRNASYP